MPKEIGPHEGKELKLMLAGKKPMAMFRGVGPDIECFPLDDFEPYVKTGEIFMKQFEGKAETPKGIMRRLYTYYTLPNEKWRIDEMIKIQDDIKNNPRFDLVLERKIGQLLGYTEYETDQFIKWHYKNKDEIDRIKRQLKQS
ncbi:MAG: hypothetical protein ACTSXQ_02645 [Alphaproteobacteria bacterium]